MGATHYLRFPPGMGHVLVPSGPPAAAALGMTLYTASRLRPLTAQRLLWLLARAGGIRAVPGRRERWRPPMGEDVLSELLSQWRDAVGAPVVGLAIYNRPQEHRPALSLMVCAGKRSLLVRVRPEARGLMLEQRVSEVAETFGANVFHVPRLRASGSAGGWSWVGYEVIGQRPHAPARSAGPELFAQVSKLVETAVPRPDTCPVGWRGSHGDLTPWNLRRSGGRVWLIDWEDARFAPPGADEVYFALTRAALGGKSWLKVAGHHAEARQYWIAALTTRLHDDKGAELVVRMLKLLTEAAIG